MAGKAGGGAGAGAPAEQPTMAQNGYLEADDSLLVLDRDKRATMINEFDQLIKSLDENEASLETMFHSKALEAQHALDEKVKDLQVYTMTKLRGLLRKRTQI